jgi:hypothetical protein
VPVRRYTYRQRGTLQLKVVDQALRCGQVHNVNCLWMPDRQTPLGRRLCLLWHRDGQTAPPACSGFSLA